MEEYKQVLVMRKFPSLRKGKYIAQGAHASAGVIMDLRLEKNTSTAIVLWIRDGYKKICVYVETEEELLAIYDKAVEANLYVHLVTDSGLTEFGGVPTKTCLAIGPNRSSEIDKITGELPLF